VTGEKPEALLARAAEATSIDRRATKASKPG